MDVAIRGSMHTPFADARLPPMFCDPITTSYRIRFVHVWNVTSKWTPESRLDRTCPWRLQLSIYASIWEYNPDLRVDTVMLAAAWGCIKPQQCFDLKVSMPICIFNKHAILLMYSRYNVYHVHNLSIGKSFFGHKRNILDILKYWPDGAAWKVKFIQREIPMVEPNYMAIRLVVH